jgi:hypothetical protein
MIEIGTLVDATLIAKEPHFIFKYNNCTIIVDKVFSSWLPSVEPDIQLGEIVKVRIRAIMYHQYPDQYYYGSIRNVAENNPYLEIASLPPMTVIRGKLKYQKITTQQLYSIILPNKVNCEILPQFLPNTIPQDEIIDVIVNKIQIDDDWCFVLVESLEKNSRKKFVPKYQIYHDTDFNLIRSIAITKNDTIFEYGTIVNATLKDKCNNGVFFEYQKNKIFVDYSNMSWLVEDVSFDSFTIGDKLPVRIIGYDYIENNYYGSIKHLMKNNPYKELSYFHPNTVFRGVIQEKISPLSRSIYAGHYKILLPNKTIGYYCPFFKGKEMVHEIGEYLDVIISVLGLSSENAFVVFETPNYNHRKQFVPEQYVIKYEDFISCTFSKF